MPGIRIAIICAFLLSLFLPVSGLAQSAPTAPQEITREGVRDMLARMSDAEVRDMLLDRLDAAAQAEELAQPPLTKLAEAVSQVGAGLQRAFTGIPETVSVEARAISTFVAAQSGTGLGWLFAMMVAVLAIALAAEFATVQLSRRWFAPPSVTAGAPLGPALKHLTLRLLGDGLGLVVFYIAARIALGILIPPAAVAFAGLVFGALILLPRVGAALSRFLLAPQRPELRMVPLDDDGSGTLHRNLVGLFILMGLVVFVVRFNIAYGVQPGESQIGFWLNSAVHVYIALIAWWARDCLTQAMLGNDPERTVSDERVAHLFPIFMIFVSALMWLTVQFVAYAGDPTLLRSAPHYVTMFWLILAPVIDTVVRGLAHHLQPPMIGNGTVAEAAYRAARRSFVRIGRMVVLTLVLILVARAWQIDLWALPGNNAGGFGAALFRCGVTLAIGYVVFETATLWINRRLARENTTAQKMDSEASGEGGGTGGGSRLATVLPLVRITAQIAIAVIFVLLAVGTLGIDIAPLLAGAGIVGLAIGFGAQKLVSDVVSGVFFLIDDAFRIGEYVDIGGTMGSVEKISIRSLRLRHHRGAVHTIPYGEISKLTNYSRDWVIMKLKFTVPFDTDPNKIKRIFKKIGADMMANETLKDGFLEPFKSQGVFEFSDVGMVVRGKFMARPGQQFTLRKEIYNRVQAEFAAASIEFARPEVRITRPRSEDAADETAAENAAAIIAAAERRPSGELA